MLQALAESDSVDAVYISSPTSEHARQAILLLQHKKHVLLEKPACSNAAELAAVIEAARGSGCVFMEAMRPLKTPNFLRVRNALAGLGKVCHFSASFCQLSTRWPAYCKGERPNAFMPEFSNGALMDIGCYGVLHPPPTLLLTHFRYTLRWPCSGYQARFLIHPLCWRRALMAPARCC